MGDSEKVFIIFYNLCRRIAKFQDHGVSEDSLSCGGRKDRIIGSFNNFINLLGSGYGISMCPELLIPCRNAQWPPKKVADARVQRRLGHHEDQRIARLSKEPQHQKPGAGDAMLVVGREQIRQQKTPLQKRNENV